ncbi:hypothetical protein EOA32_14395 [Mesorhizobium sp. M1A.F.Ca.ET.072.01.1.1]|uniref:hypothetical protein n=1 Tax=Mesorhizobium sp. M1A.F.Ca.ET.072.01.1.1 TaxID=2496753 RepID=UPI000FD46311|nr:hypothetical protein [Mesorhizobium sp. M1A.F.Ca.ET.072.01.1.1]RUW51976.1 hypothetical protein EOA32_14395 [Mesorhizobium sp. M1A.F.Ca.ET.072.01.1.1]TIV03848.1 MAG: hypothetical protein E5W04_06255 [Mesorhizobium sp.]
MRSQTLVVTNNQVVYDFGRAGDTLLALGSGSFLGVVEGDLAGRFARAAYLPVPSPLRLSSSCGVWPLLM